MGPFTAGLQPVRLQHRLFGVKIPDTLTRVLGILCLVALVSLVYTSVRKVMARDTEEKEAE